MLEVHNDNEVQLLQAQDGTSSCGGTFYPLKDFPHQTSAERCFVVSVPSHWPKLPSCRLFNDGTSSVSLLQLLHVRSRMARTTESSRKVSGSIVEAKPASVEAWVQSLTDNEVLWDHLGWLVRAYVKDLSHRSRKVAYLMKKNQENPINDSSNLDFFIRTRDGRENEDHDGGTKNKDHGNIIGDYGTLLRDHWWGIVQRYHGFDI
ncbi:unnamed protein product [Amoebophrya sp. A25]|nr:unnamed protein product [Amoebophrya sp. A25]|eukprot:GSA25T00004928001.1